ncbi:hypothetical protein [Candidatus Solirubrobacter pratensis]|uniref:hypothetical protein n=1 Tax=Candidatus Solirubrobacter pratensis TaxID=1298857 RepID=UPI0004825D59|nr:hypothetical protein [Candidatus Solirubrobacter pratensis]
MIRALKLSNKYQKRTLRALYGQTQAYPFAGNLDDTFRAADGSLVLPVASGSANPARTSAAFTIPNKNTLPAGLVMVKAPGQGDRFKVAVGNDALSGERPFGLLANMVGGEIDELGDENMIGVWRGPDSVFELLAPAFDPAIATAAASNVNAGAPLALYAGADGRLTSTAPVSTTNVTIVAHLVEAVGTSRIVVDLRV